MSPKQDLRQGRRPTNHGAPGWKPGGVGPVLPRTCMSTLSRSRGAVQVLDTAPAPPPATRCLHHIPVCLSSTVNSSGTVRFSPTSKICEEDQPGSNKQALAPAAKLAVDSKVHNVPPSRMAGTPGSHPDGENAKNYGWDTDAPPPVPLKVAKLCSLPVAQRQRPLQRPRHGMGERSWKEAASKPRRQPARGCPGAPAKTACTGISAERCQAGCTEPI